MVDYEYLFSMKLRERLFEEVHGKIFVAVRDDELYVKIQNRTGLVFETSFGNFATSFIGGWTTEHAAIDILEIYKRYVMREYFK